MNYRKCGANRKREDGDHFRAAGYGSAPCGIREAQNGGNQRAGMAKADPENEIRDVKAPEDRTPNPGDTDAAINLPAKRAERRNDDPREESERRQIARRRAMERPQQIFIYLFRSLRRHAMSPVVGK